MRFGDIVINEWAGDQNPQKALMIIHHGRKVKCVSLTGQEVIFDNDKNLRLKKISSINFSVWREIASNQVMHTDGEDRCLKQQTTPYCV